MQVEQAIATLRRSGQLLTDAGRIRYRGPVTSGPINEALVALKLNRDMAISILDGKEAGRERTDSIEDVLRGRAVELWSDAAGGRFWLVADSADANRLNEPRGTVYTASEARRLATIRDPKVVREVNEWKRRFNGSLSEIDYSKGRNRTN